MARSGKRYTPEHEVRPPRRPTLDDYFTAIEDLATLLRKALDRKGVKRGELRKALVAYERLRDEAAQATPASKMR